LRLDGVILDRRLTADVPIANVAHDGVESTRSGTAETAAAGLVDLHDIVALQRNAADTTRQRAHIPTVRADDARAQAAGEATGQTVGRNPVFAAPEGELHLRAEHFVFADEAEAAALRAGPAGIALELEATKAHRKLRFEDLDRRRL